MRSTTLRADADGKILNAAGRGIGFMLTPAVSQGASATIRPGSFPVKVRFIGEGEPFEVSAAKSYERREFQGFAIEGCESGDSWEVTVLEECGERVSPPATRTRVPVQVQASAAIPTIAPTLVTEGARVRPGTIGHTFYFTGVAQLIRIWVRSRGGTWFDTGEDIDTAAQLVEARQAFMPGDRIYLRAPLAGTNVEIDAVEEVG